MYKRSHLAGMLVVCLSAVVLVGCGGDGLERAPITGLITVEGAPLAGAVVQFLPADGTPGGGAIGTSDAEGKFEVISSRRNDEGIPPGEYSVRVGRLIMPDGTALPPDVPDADYPEAFESIPLPYSSTDSPLKVTIGKEGGEVKIDIPVKLIDGKGKK